MTLGLHAPHSMPNTHGTDAYPDETQKSLRKSIADLQTHVDGAVEYRYDARRAAEDPTKRPHRTVHFKCAFCASTTVIDQFKTDDAWPTNEIAQATLFGWTHGICGPTDDQQDRWFCGATCKNRFETKMRSHGNDPLPVAASVRGAGVVRDLYATQARTVVDPPNAIDSQDVTTPAAPPVRHRK